jgi:radical SAM protein
MAERVWPVWEGRRYLYDRAPFLVYLEITRACDLACRHCRAEAIPWRHPEELSTTEVRGLLEDLGRFPRRPHLVITGGDPLKRPDLWEILATARALGQPVSLTPSTTPTLTPAVIERLRTVGLASLALSLDGATPATHEAIRGVEGSFRWAQTALAAALETGLKVQINTLVCRETMADLPALYGFLRSRPILRWSLFFLIRTGRGRVMQEVAPTEAEDLMAWLLDLGEEAHFEIKVTEAHHYRRLAIQRSQSGESPRPLSPAIRRGFGVRDGNGVVFISHRGDVYPSGFLPIPVGNIRRQSLVTIYQSAPLLQALRRPDGFYGKCGRCLFREVCGGSRARAFAATGNPLASDPLCPYQPPRDAALAGQHPSASERPVR